MKCLVTGGCGFIGSNLVDKLIDLGHEVTIFDNLSSGKVENINERARFIEVDISSDDELKECKKWFDGVDTIFHTAAKARVQPSIIDPINFNKTNVDLQATTKEEYLFGITSSPTVFNDLFIDRGRATVIQSHMQLGEIKNMSDLINYGNGFYNL